MVGGSLRGARGGSALPRLVPVGNGARRGRGGGRASGPVASTLPGGPCGPGERVGWGSISRRRTIRWRGVVVRLRLGQTGSHEPHPTHQGGGSPNRGGRFVVGGGGP